MNIQAQWHLITRRGQVSNIQQSFFFFQIRKASLAEQISGITVCN